MRILLSITNLGIGGAQVFTVRLANELSRHHQVALYCWDGADIDRGLLGKISGSVRVFCFPLPAFFQRVFRGTSFYLGRVGLRRSLWDFLRNNDFRRRVRQWKPDLIHSHLFHSDYLCVSPDPGVPAVMTDHGDYRFLIGKGSLSRERSKELLGRFQGFIHVCQTNQRYLRQLLPDRSAQEISIVYGCAYPGPSDRLAVRGRLGIPAEAMVFGMVARGIEEKGWRQALEAFRRMSGPGSEKARLVFVGDGPALRSLRRSVSGDLAQRVLFTGATAFPERLMSAFDVGVLPSYFAGESLPNFLIECLSFGKPVIATRIGGIPELLEYGGITAGILIDLDDRGKADVAALSKAMKRYLEEEGLLREHSALAAKGFSKFSMEKCARDHERFYECVLGRTAGQGNRSGGQVSADALEANASPRDQVR